MVNHNGETYSLWITLDINSEKPVSSFDPPKLLSLLYRGYRDIFEHTNAGHFPAKEIMSEHLSNFQKGFWKSCKNDQKCIFYISTKKEKIYRTNRFVFSFEYSRMSEHIKRTIRSNWHIPTQDPDLRDRVSDPPIISFHRCKNIRNELVSSQMMEEEKDNWLNRSFPRENHRCGHCSFCEHM